MEEVFVHSFKKHTHPQDSLILAVSGGVDSMVLLDLVLRNHPKDKIIVAHFDHSLRGSESDGDREMIIDFCRERSIVVEIEKMDINTLAQTEKMSIESIARKYRYEFLRAVAGKYSTQLILTAHHQDDQVETMVFNLIRGTKLGGIAALKEIQESGVGDAKVQIFRPLLSIPKSEILLYAEEHKIIYREDASNTDTKYLRNKLRHDILPGFEMINPEYRRALSNFIGYTEELQDWIDGEIVAFLGDSESFSIKDFREKSPFFQKEIIRYLYEQANDGTIGLSEGNIEEMLRYILTAEGGTEKLVGRLRFTKRNNTISF